MKTAKFKVGDLVQGGSNKTGSSKYRIVEVAKYVPADRICGYIYKVKCGDEPDEGVDLEWYDEDHFTGFNQALLGDLKNLARQYGYECRWKDSVLSDLEELIDKYK